MKRELKDGNIGDEIENWMENHENIRDEIYKDVISRGGVVSGEHGIGLAKKDYLSRNIDPEAVAMMKAIKKALDPANILNSGKIFS
jgi:glycolate oxidase